MLSGPDLPLLQRPGSSYGKVWVAPLLASWWRDLTRPGCRLQSVVVGSEPRETWGTYREPPVSGAFH